MRCINMKIIDVLLFSFTLMAVKCVSPPTDKTSQPVNNGNLNKFESDCPDLWKIIQTNNLTGWINCQNKSGTIKSPKEEDVLEFACFLAKNMLVFICDRKLNMTNEYLNSSKDPICPFQFSRLIELGLLAEELKNKEKCNKVCEDLYETRIQCVILKKLNNFLRSFELQISRIGIVQSGEKKSEITSYIHEADKINDRPINSKAIKNMTNKTKTETTSNKEATSPVGPLSTNETKNPKLEKPSPDLNEPENFEPYKPESEKFEPDKPESEKFEPAEKLKVSQTDEESKDLKKDEYLEEGSENKNLPDVPKSGLEEIRNLEESRVESENEKDQIFHQKEINSNDSFLQAEDSHFFFYFITVSSIIVIGYIGFHNKNKILAYALEGTSGRRSRRRPNPARYRKLETNLEEVISSNTSETVASSVVY